MEAIKADLNNCARLKITVTGSQNEELFGAIEEIFNSVSFPEQVKSIYLNSKLTYESIYKYFPENSFELFVDFSKPKIFDFSIQPSEKTPNESFFQVQGADNTWVNGVFHEIDAYIKAKPSKFANVHKGGIYDILVWLFGIPFGFWVCYKVIQLNLLFFNSHAFVQNIFLTYCFFLSLLFLRILFHYFRWVYPMIEYRGRNERSIVHQTTLFGIIISIVSSIVYDVIKLLAK